jgi:ABC-type glutathione transport system ATPase component
VTAANILEVRSLCVDYRTRRTGIRADTLRAVRDVSLHIGPGEFVGVVGETGSGKSSVADAIMGLVRPSRGTIALDGVDLTRLRGRQARRRRRRAQMIMQDPYEALDPHMTIGKIVEEPLLVHGAPGGRAARDRLVRETLEAAGLASDDDFVHRHPRELSGGQRQRVCIAAAVIVKPNLLIADEPVSMLDMSVRAGILHLLDAQRAAGAAILMITHDLPTAAAFCNRIFVMRDGEIVEEGAAQTIVHAPKTAYTRSLLDAVPRLHQRRETPNVSDQIADRSDDAGISDGFGPALDLRRQDQPSTARDCS